MRGRFGPFRLRRTRQRRITSLGFGHFLAVEQTGYYPDHPELPAVRSKELAAIVAPGTNHAFDLVVRIGIAHHLECRQHPEIKEELISRHGIEVPERTIGQQARKFVAYVQVVHHESAALLRRDMLRRGGYILHIDGTCEEGSRVLLVCMDSVSGQILDGKKIGSENAAEVRDVLEGVREEWGVPLAAVHDLGKALLAAVPEVFPGVPQFVCHYHFAADVGKDILGPGVDRLRSLFREVRLRPKLGTVARSLKEFAVDADGAHVLSALLDGSPPGSSERDLPEGTGLGLVHGLVSWILAYSRAGQGYGFPFDVPYLELYERVVAVNDLLADLPADGKRAEDRIVRELERVRGILAPVVEGERVPEFAQAVAELRRDRKVFEALRSRLRICPRDGNRRRNDEGVSAAVDPERHRTILANFKLSLETRSRWKTTAARACRIVLTHLDDYWPYLFGHRLPGAHGIVVPRTNNIEESGFRKVKQGCRRLHGRGHLKREVDEMPAAAVLLQNLRQTEYRKTVYGGLEEEDIAARFSAVDPAKVAEVMRNWRQDRLTSRLPRKLERSRNLPARLAGFVKAVNRTLRERA